MARRSRRQSSQSNSSFYQVETSSFLADFVRTFLYSVLQGHISYGDFTVSRVLAQDPDGYILRPPTVHDSDGDTALSISDTHVLASVQFNGQPYELVCCKVKEFMESFFVVAATGIASSSIEPAALIKFVFREAQRHSPFRGKAISIQPRNSHRADIVQILSTELGADSLDMMFVPEPIREHVDLFVEAIVRYDEYQRPIRYLLNGKPGTGKTGLVRAIANAVKGKATIILTNGSDEMIDQTFDLAQCFTPVVICIDDVDMIAGDRQTDSRKALGKFLQRLDGFTNSSAFVLATTNDKTLVDMAASRPGRFDMILDIPPIERGYYMSLIGSKTERKDIIALFTEEVLDGLEARKATGAFIAVLVKQLELRSHLGRERVSPDEVQGLIQRMSQGFSRRSGKTADKVGFQLPDC